MLKSPKVKQVLGLPDLSKLRKAGSTGAAAGSSQAELVGKPVVTFTQKPPLKPPQKPRQGGGKKHAAAAAATAAAASK